MEIDLFEMAALALVAAAAFLILSMPKFNERLAFLTAICRGAVATIFVLQALR